MTDIENVLASAASVDDKDWRTTVSRCLRTTLAALGLTGTSLFITGFGTALLFTPQFPFGAGCVAAGLFGVVSGLHRARCKHLEYRRSTYVRLAFLQDMKWDNPEYAPMELRRVVHEGLAFASWGFVQLPITVEITRPLCPNCGNVVAERASVPLFGRTTILFLCSCGWKTKSKYTEAELTCEAAHLLQKPAQ